LAGAPFTFTCPAVQTPVAADLVLHMRTAHNHLSTLVASIESILTGENQVVLRYLIITVVLLAAWTHWRAAYTGEARAALADLPAGAEQLDELIWDLRDNRLAFRCKAVLADQRAGDEALFREHLADALERIEHLERFAPLRRLRQSSIAW
jgi:hypothetical protein